MLACYLRAGSLLLLFYSWLSSWRTLITSFIGLVMDGPTLRCAGPFYVCLAGVVITNVRGWSKFRRDGKGTRALFAALDLVVPQLLVCDGPSFCRSGEPQEDLQAVKLRHGIWRSLPLGIVTLVLVSLNTFEIPVCQLLVGKLAETGGRQALDGLNPNGTLPGMYGLISMAVGDPTVIDPEVFKSPPDTESSLVHSRLKNEYDYDVLVQFWDCSHCLQSYWFNRSEFATFGQLVADNSFGILGTNAEKSVCSPGVGTGSLCALNRLLKHRAAQARDSLSTWQFDPDSSNLWLGLQSIFFQRSKTSDKRILGLSQWRPWRFQFAFALSMLVCATLPIQNRIMKRQEVHSIQVKILLVAYGFADILCLAALLMLTAMSLQAAGLEQVLSSFLPGKLEEGVIGLFRTATLTNWASLLSLLTATCAFCGANLLVIVIAFGTKVSFGQALISCPCSPLYLTCFDSVSLYCDCNALCALVVARAAIFTTTVELMWENLSGSSFEAWSALVFNMELSRISFHISAAILSLTPPVLGISALWAIGREAESEMRSIGEYEQPEYGATNALNPREAPQRACLPSSLSLKEGSGHYHVSDQA